MWMFLYKLSSPRYFYNATGSILPVIKWLAGFFLILGVIWGLVFAPADYQQSDAFRIIYIHVPAAFMSMALYGLMAFCAVLLLVWQIKLAGIIMSATVGMGASMAFCALVTGSIWGKPMWGTWWTWDARLTSELILLLLYLAILAVLAAISDYRRKDQMAAILILVGVVDLPIIHYSVYWWNTLHQGATLSLLSKPKIAPAMLYPLLLTLLGFGLLCCWIIMERARTGLLLREKKQRWVQGALKLNRSHDDCNN